MEDVDWPITQAPRWAGEDLSGKRLVVCPEQGWGDQIMWGRYLPRLRDLGAEVVLFCHPKLGRLFERLGFWTRPAVIDRALPPCDFWTPFGALPRLVAGELPCAEYLGFPIGSGGGVGVVPTGNPAHFNDRQRSLPPRHAAQLLAVGRDLRPEATGLYDFSDTADLIADLNLIITVDTAMAHLAGSMGKRCWVLLPYERMDARWGDGIRSPWYPALRLFRQPESGCWESVLKRVGDEAGELLSALGRDLHDVDQHSPGPARARGG